MERNLTVPKTALAVLLAALLCVASGCTKIPRSERVSENETSVSVPAETDNETDHKTDPTGEEQTDENGFPNAPEDGHTKRY